MAESKTLSAQFMKTPSLVLRLKASLQGPEAWAPGLEQVQGKGPNISTSQCPFCRAPRSVLLWGKRGPIIMHLSVGCQWASFWVVSLHLETQTICQLLGSLFGLQLLKWTVYTIHKCTTSWIQNEAEKPTHKWQTCIGFILSAGCIQVQPQIRKSWDSMENANKKRK